MLYQAPTPRVQDIVNAAQVKFDLDFGDLSLSSHQQFREALEKLETIVARGKLDFRDCWRRRCHELKRWANAYFAAQVAA